MLTEASNRTLEILMDSPNCSAGTPSSMHDATALCAGFRPSSWDSMAPPTRESAPRTVAVRRALEQAHCDAAVADLLFLESWEASPSGEVAAVLRVAQIRRANPQLAKEVRGELAEAVRRAAPDCKRPR